MYKARLAPDFPMMILGGIKFHQIDVLWRAAVFLKWAGPTKVKSLSWLLQII